MRVLSSVFNHGYPFAHQVPIYHLPLFSFLPGMDNWLIYFAFSMPLEICYQIRLLIRWHIMWVLPTRFHAQLSFWTSCGNFIASDSFCYPYMWNGTAGLHPLPQVCHIELYWHIWLLKHGHAMWILPVHFMHIHPSNHPCQLYCLFFIRFPFYMRWKNLCIFFNSSMSHGIH